MKHRPFTLIELVTVVFILAFLTCFCAPTRIEFRLVARKMKCLSNLRDIARAAMTYAAAGNGYFPMGEGENPPAHKSLQVVADFLGADAKPELFVCPSSMRVPAEVDYSIEDRCPFQLAAQNVSYAWTMRRLSTSDMPASVLAADDSIQDPERGILENHRDGICVVDTHGSASWIRRDELERWGWDPTPHHLTPPPGGRHPVKGTLEPADPGAPWTALGVVGLTLVAFLLLAAVLRGRKGSREDPPPGEGRPESPVR